MNPTTTETSEELEEFAAHRRQVMATALIRALQAIDEERETRGGLASKDDVFRRSYEEMSSELAGVVGSDPITFSGYNWIGSGEHSYPGPSASVALTLRDAEDNIVAVAMAAVNQTDQKIILADGEGLHIGSVATQSVGFNLVTKVEPYLLALPPRVAIFGQKTGEPWMALGAVIGWMNEAGLPTANDCGSFYGITSWFNSCEDEAINPQNLAYVEPYAVAGNDELMPWVVMMMNINLPPEQQFVVTDMSGTPLFDDRGRHRDAELYIPGHRRSGYVIAPTKEAHAKVLDALAGAVTFVPSFRRPDAERMQVELRYDLARWAERRQS